MKKFIVLLLIAALTLCSLSAEENAGLDLLFHGIDAFFTIMSNTNDKDIIRQQDFLDKVAQMSEAERGEYYNTHKKNAIGPALLDLAVGAGAGANLLGNRRGGVFAKVMDESIIAVSVTPTVIWGFIYGIGYVVSAGNWTPRFFEPELGQVALNCLKLGACALGVSHVVQALNDFGYAGSYNRLLKKNLSFAVVPYDNGVMAAASITF